MNIQGVEHDLRGIEQIDSGLCNNEDTQRVIQVLGSMYTNEQQQLRKLCFFNLEALAKDAVGQNFIPDNIFVLVFFIVRHLEIIQYKFIYAKKKWQESPQKPWGLCIVGFPY